MELGALPKNLLCIRYSVKSIYSLSRTVQLVYTLNTKMSSRITGPIYSRIPDVPVNRDIVVLTRSTDNEKCQERRREKERERERIRGGQLKLHGHLNRVILAFKYTTPHRRDRLVEEQRNDERFKNF